MNANIMLFFLSSNTRFSLSFDGRGTDEEIITSANIDARLLSTASRRRAAGFGPLSASDPPEAVPARGRRLNGEATCTLMEEAELGDDGVVVTVESIDALSMDFRPDSDDFLG